MAIALCSAYSPDLPEMVMEAAHVFKGAALCPSRHSGQQWLCRPSQVFM
jgi:hypothetical protein